MGTIISDAEQHVELLSSKRLDTCTRVQELDPIQGLAYTEKPFVPIPMTVATCSERLEAP